MKKIIYVAFLLLSVNSLFAQDYTHSLGIRLGSGYYDNVGIAYKTFVTDAGAIEADLGFRGYNKHGYKWTNVSLAGAYQHHFPIGKIENFNWFVGGGLVLANSFSDYDERDGVSLGIFPTGGVEYRLKNAPFVFSADIRPTFHIVEANDYHNSTYVNAGLTARYVF
nr:hypothetical protein [uncultured Flavobacterium sp.]